MRLHQFQHNHCYILGKIVIYVKNYFHECLGLAVIETIACKIMISINVLHSCVDGGSFISLIGKRLTQVKC